MTRFMPEGEEFSSWLESRRLIISQLSAMEASIRDLGVRIDKYNDTSRERANELSREAQDGMSDLRLRVAMLELRAKLWGAGLGVLSGASATGVTQLFMNSFHH
jgi:hypothetical protein